MMDGPSSEIHLCERRKLTSKSAAAGSSSSLSSAVEGNATAGTCHHASPRGRDASSVERWGCVGTSAAAGKWVWLRKCTYGLSGELAVLLPAWMEGLGDSSPLLLFYLHSQMSPCPHRPLWQRGRSNSCRKGTGTV